jgi:cytochrome c-type biogenesis protein CcmH
MRQATGHTLQVAGRRSQVAGLMLAVFVSIAAGAQPLKVPDAEQFVGPPHGTPVSGNLLDQRAHEIAGQLRCPVCQGLSIADSPSEMAMNMKGQVRELLSRGYTEEQILAYFERSYGQFVLLKPKFSGLTSLVWTLPIFVLLLGAILVVVKIRKLQNAGEGAGAPPSDDDYVARVRDLVNK